MFSENSDSGFKIYKCILCTPEIEFDWLTRYRRHLMSSNHRRSGAYFCPICWFSTVQRKEFLTHRNEHGLNKVPMSCPNPFCNQEFEKWESYRQHIQRRHTVNNGDGLLFRCHLPPDVCEFTTTDPVAWVKHTRAEMKQFCTHCETKFISAASLHSHFTKVHKKELKRKNNNVSKVNVNIPVPEGIDEKLWDQIQTGKMFFEPQPELNWKIKCPFCRRKKLFTTEAALRAHAKREHSLILPFRCTHCRQMCPNKYAFNQHILRHRPTTNGKTETTLETPGTSEEYNKFFPKYEIDGVESGALFILGEDVELENVNSSMHEPSLENNHEMVQTM